MRAARRLLLAMLAGSLCLGGALQAHAMQTLTLQDAIDSALQQNPSINIARAQEDAAVAGVTTAKAYINPEVEIGGGPTRYRRGTESNGNNYMIGLAQPLEFSGVRSARRELAEAGVKVAEVGTDLARIDLRARVKSAFYDVLQREAVLKLVEGDRTLLKDIRERVKLRVDVGESPRYELIKADTELLAAERDYQAALIRVAEGKAYLRGLIGPTVGDDFELSGELPLTSSLPSLESLRERLEQSPQLAQIRAATEAADNRVRLEEALRMPGVTVKAGVDQDPDMNSFHLGVAVPLPLWSQRQGQIAEAAAGAREVRSILSERELALRRDLDSSYQRYLIARQQVSSFENGLLSQSEAVLKTAEAAYRYGERGILEYLDAQRTFRVVRKDYLTARYDYVNAMLEIERVLGTEILEDKP
ncbi:MAG TPA: TolC family protein [Methylophilaceae bacterium]|nr:TolC family protein [Methylophilaceae bacterium]